MDQVTLWLQTQVAPLDAAAPMWLPWVSALVLLAALILTLFLRRRAALKAAFADASAKAASLHAAEVEAARSAVQIGTSADAISRLEAELAEARGQITTLRAEHEARGADLSARTAQIAALIANADSASQSLAEAQVRLDRLRADLEKRLAEVTRRAETAERELAALRAQTEQERLAAEEKLALLTQVRTDMQRSFKDLADTALKTSSEELTKTSRERLEAALNPLKEHVALFQTELKANHESALRDREALKAEIQMLSRQSEAVSKEAVALTRALKGDKQRQGAWGEMVLEGILERSGLRKGEEYTTQDSHQGDEGNRLRSDVIVKMPQGSALVIDSKVSLVDYEIAVNSEDEAEAAAARRRHVRALQSHIETISGKDYARLVGQTVDYTVMFIPIEGALSEALREQGDLTSYALEKRVMIATPTTLMMALRTVANFWTFDRRNRNAEDIAKRAGLLYEKVAGFVDAMESLGKNLTQAQSSFSTAMDRLSRGNGNVLSQVDRLKVLGARTGRKITTDFDPEPDALPPAEEPNP